MAHTNSTPNYNLPQFLPTDKPAWLVDVNPAYASIDTAIKNASDAAGNAQEDATQALADAAGANAIATQANSKADGAIASISEQFLDTATYAVGEYVIFNNILYVCTEPVTTPGPWTGSVNWTRASIDSIASSLHSEINTINNRTGSDIPLSDSSTETIAHAIEVLNTPISQTVRAGANITSFLYGVFKTGKVVNGYIVFKPTATVAELNTIFASGLPVPASNTLIIIPVTCISGTNAGKSDRVAINANGNLVSWYHSAGFFNTTDTYIVATNYAAN